MNLFLWYESVNSKSNSMQIRSINFTSVNKLLIPIQKQAIPTHTISVWFAHIKDVDFMHLHPSIYMFIYDTCLWYRWNIIWWVSNFYWFCCIGPPTIHQLKQFPFLELELTITSNSRIESTPYRVWNFW